MKYLINFFLFLLLTLSSVSAQTTENFHVFTICSHHSKGLRKLLTSCEKHEIEIDVVGLGLPYEGNVQKIIYVREYLKTLPEEAIVLYVDGFDTLFMCDAQTILDRFLAMNVRCVFGAEKDIFPFFDLAEQFPESPTQFRFLNAGTFIGYAGHILKMAEQLDVSILKGSDQGKWHPYYLNHLDEIKLDYYCELFFQLHGMSEFDYFIDSVKNQLICVTTGTVPCVIHGNGQGRDLYKSIYSHFF